MILSHNDSSDPSDEGKLGDFGEFDDSIDRRIVGYEASLSQGSFPQLIAPGFGDWFRRSRV
jgi:hypothetical protein